jgi:hypothetical protein
LWLPYAAFLATSITPADEATGNIVSYLIGFGPLGIGVVLYQLGFIVPKAVLTRSDKQSDRWRKAYEDEHAGHQATREALAVANDRAEAAVEAARVTTKLLEVIQHKDA